MPQFETLIDIELKLQKGGRPNELTLQSALIVLLITITNIIEDIHFIKHYERAIKDGNYFFIAIISIRKLNYPLLCIIIVP